MLDASLWLGLEHSGHESNRRFKWQNNKRQWRLGSCHDETIFFFDSRLHTVLQWKWATYNYENLFCPWLSDEPPGRFKWLYMWRYSHLLLNECVARTIAHADPTLLSQTPNAVLLTAFTLHYINRTLIFPFRIRGGKDTPLTPFLMATIFCASVPPSFVLSVVSVVIIRIDISSASQHRFRCFKCSCFYPCVFFMPKSKRFHLVCWPFLSLSIPIMTDNDRIFKDVLWSFLFPFLQ